MALKFCPAGISHSSGMPLKLSVSIIASTGADPQRSACRMRTVSASPAQSRLPAARTALSLVDPPEWTMNWLLTCLDRPSSSTTREKTRSAWSWSSGSQSCQSG